MASSGQACQRHHTMRVVTLNNTSFQCECELNGINNVQTASESRMKSDHALRGRISDLWA